MLRKALRFKKVVVLMIAKVKSSNDYKGMLEFIPNWEAKDWELLEKLEPLFTSVTGIIQYTLFLLNQDLNN